MDSLTHILVGHAMGAAASSVNPAWGAAAYWATLIGNSIPDIDVPISLLLRRDVRLHRTVTHTLPGTLFLAAITAFGLHGFMPEAPVLVTFQWALLGCLAHMLMDCLNLFGARPFWPFSGRSVDLGILHILDPFLLVLLGLPSLGVSLHLGSRTLLSLAFLLIWPYVSYRVATARRLLRTLRAEGYDKARIVPWFLGWRYICESADTIEVGTWVRGQRVTANHYRTEDSPIIRASLSDPQVAAFLASAQYPYATIEEDEDGLAVIWADVLRQFRADFHPLRVRVGES